MSFYWDERDKSYPSEAASLRIFGATRLHCSVSRGELSEHDESYYMETGGGLVERDLGRGDVNENRVDLFNKQLRAGHEPLRR